MEAVQILNVDCVVVPRLFQVNFVRKELQGAAVDLSSATDSFDNLMTW